MLTDSAASARRPAVIEQIARLLEYTQAALARWRLNGGWRRTAFFVAGDTVAAAGAVLAARALSSPGHELPLSTGALLAATSAALVIAINSALRNYRLAWMTFSLRDLRRLALAVLGATGAIWLLGRFFPGEFPGPVVYGMTLLLALAVFRGSRRLLLEPLLTRPTGRRALIVVSSRRAYFLPNILQQLTGFRYLITGIIDPDPALLGTHEQGLPVLGTTEEIEAVVERYRIQVVIILLESRPSFRLGEFYARLQRLGVEVKTMPSLADVIEDRSDIGALARLSIHDLTGRPPVQIDVAEMRRQFTGRTVMVTGAGGSIGSELCRQLARFNPTKLVLLERDDSNLFYIDRELRQNYPELTVVPFLGDITREDDLETVFSSEHPEIVFHAAAYKHVPILEFHPEDAVRVNALASHTLAKIALKCGTRMLVYVSTDKAVNPTSAMGASKRLGEMLVTGLNGQDMKVMAVRFGNVLDSRGSVSTIFRDAIARRAPITVTHREMRRYLMLTTEAVLLVLQAASLGRGGEVFVLDMGTPVRIWDLAHRMVELAGLTPNVDIPIIETGIRPGEKLFEELLTAEEGTVATTLDRVFRARVSRRSSYEELLRRVETAQARLLAPDPNVVKDALAGLVDNYQPDYCLGLSPSCHLSVTAHPAVDDAAPEPRRAPAARPARRRQSPLPIPRVATA